MEKILVVGSGAIAGLYGGKLSQAGCKVDFLVRSEVELLRKCGFQINSVWGDFHFHPENVFGPSEDIDLDKYDFIFCCLKVLPEIRIKKILGREPSKNTALVLLQNGIGIEAPVSEDFPNSEIISGLAFVCANRLSPGVISHIDYGALNFGSWNRNDSPKSKRISELFSNVGVPTEYSDDIRSARWKKLMWNAPFNPLSVITGGCDTTRLLSDPVCKRMIFEIMQEVQMLGESFGAVFPENFIENLMDMSDKMKPYKTSMLLDFEAGRKMETEAILGNAVRMAKEKNLEIPRINTLYAILRFFP
ncbi:2-dehydropantoate 2-reductase [Leptospira perolatii]|uniref:2-dehydropantoate 2-reductase n=1 Tax=Leptospira perolatii TaxID=2023191 RepID=A0A2M9ZJX9_9LEPT|nr:2-dehydropantoate 2-reductase [Leptospira perolatii]PJZ69459.1 2-dehydropantoate 2-reductase [Leptospira perolatii]PJZ72284.1 2-dehydropantoate 2-reductase [Leptospira perolatii]